MKQNNLTALAISLSLLVSFIIYGCANQEMTGPMDKNIEPAMEGTMDTMNSPEMRTPMSETADQGMSDNMGEMNDKTLIPEKEKMMK